MTKKDFKKSLIYDPRIGREVESNNPALILADLILNATAEAYKKFFWEQHGERFQHLADYCESKDLSGVEGVGVVLENGVFSEEVEGG